MMQKYCESVLCSRTILVADIMAALKELEEEELEAVERYCLDYHALYRQSGDGCIVTEITREPEHGAGHRP